MPVESTPLERLRQKYNPLPFILSLVVLSLLIPWISGIVFHYPIFLWYYPLPGILISVWLYKNILLGQKEYYREYSILLSSEQKVKPLKTSSDSALTDSINIKSIKNIIAPSR